MEERTAAMQLDEYGNVEKRHQQKRLRTHPAKRSKVVGGNNSCDEDPDDFSPGIWIQPLQYHRMRRKGRSVKC